MGNEMEQAIMTVLRRETRPAGYGGAGVIDLSNYELASRIQSEVAPDRPELVEVIEEALESFDKHEVDGESHNSANGPEDLIEKLSAEIERVGEQKPGILKAWFKNLFGK